MVCRIAINGVGDDCLPHRVLEVVSEMKMYRISIRDSILEANLIKAEKPRSIEILLLD